MAEDSHISLVVLTQTVQQRKNNGLQYEGRDLMGGKGKFNDFGWHNEFQSVNRKKEKAADCIYLDEDRICNCKKCMYYLGKCFYSTHCPFREKEKKAKEEKELHRTSQETKEQPVIMKKAEKIPDIKCPLPIGAKVTTKHGKKGRVVEKDNAKNYLIIQFEDNAEMKKFRYPDAFEKGFLIANQEYQKYITRQIKELLKEPY